MMGNASKVVSSLVDAFNASDMTRIMSHFTDESVYHNIPVQPVTGEKAIRDVIQGFMGMSSKVDWTVLQMQATVGQAGGDGAHVSPSSTRTLWARRTSSSETAREA